MSDMEKMIHEYAEVATEELNTRLNAKFSGYQIVVKMEVNITPKGKVKEEPKKDKDVKL